MTRAWNTRPAVKQRAFNKNAAANRKAIQAMSDCEIQTNLTADELKAYQLAQKKALHDKQLRRVQDSLDRPEAA
jgi:hypothetical protein